jgi:transcription elongation factor Elf1
MEKKTLKNPKKYWYRKEIYSCVLCGRENSYRNRVYKEGEKGVFWRDDACGQHFI